MTDPVVKGIVDKLYGVDCTLCNEPLEGPSASELQPMHRECVLRSVAGGIGHHLDHLHFCKAMRDPDAGLDYRTSALLVDVLLTRRPPI